MLTNPLWIVSAHNTLRDNPTQLDRDLRQPHVKSAVVSCINSDRNRRREDCGGCTGRRSSNDVSDLGRGTR